MQLHQYLQIDQKEIEDIINKYVLAVLSAPAAPQVPEQWKAEETTDPTTEDALDCTPPTPTDDAPMLCSECDCPMDVDATTLVRSFEPSGLGFKV